ncbi:hypothetical protein N9954_09035, partial [Maribacter sp.]|nr:hypothetical protein [Maribacter sp.]
MSHTQNISDTLTLWKSHWETAKREWNPFVRLQEPIWCTSNHMAIAEGLTGSFAMIRLTDHRIVINIEEIVTSGISDYALEILAHEIGHHIFTPANLYDNAVLLGRIRWGLPGIEDRAPMVSNLYTDFLINDKLQRINKLRMMQVYQTINSKDDFTELWTLIMRTYEYLWHLKRGTLASNLSLHSPKIDADASLIAGLVRSYSKNWLYGGGRFAVMLFPYLMEDAVYENARKKIVVLLDAEQAGMGGDTVSGMTEIDTEGSAGVIDLRKETLEGKES